MTMTRPTRRLRMVAATAALWLVASSCATSSSSPQVGLLIVTLDAPASAPADLHVPLHISAPDFLRHLTLTPRRRQFAIETSVGGDYELDVESAQQEGRIGQLLSDLRGVLRAARGRPDGAQADDIAEGLDDLSTTVAELEDAGVGSCSGHVDPGTRVAATVTWTSDGLSQTCGSS